VPAEFSDLQPRLDRPDRAPREFANSLPPSWIDDFDLKGDTLCLHGKARKMTVFLLAAPTMDALRKKLLQLATGGTFNHH
jgi:hypothetical protein